MEVVFPVPLTPKTRMTKGLRPKSDSSKLSGEPLVATIFLSSPLSRLKTCSRSLATPERRVSSRKCKRTRSVAATPKSEPISIASNRDNVSSSNFPTPKTSRRLPKKDCRVLASPAFNFPKEKFILSAKGDFPFRWHPHRLAFQPDRNDFGDAGFPPR